jgi:hypothetical protein
MSKRKLMVGVFGAGSLLWGKSQGQTGFVPPTQADPADTYTAAIGVNYSQVQTFTEQIHYDSDFNPAPDVYWFKYTADGHTAVTFDTLGSNFGSNGPSGGTSGSGGVLGTSNESEIAVYNSTGKLMGLAKNVVDSSGNPVEVAKFLNEPEPPPTTHPLPVDYYYSEGLSQISFAPNAPSNPRWAVSPNDPNTYTSWVAPDNITYGNTVGENYAPLNEYRAWASSLSPYKLNADGSTNVSNGAAVTQSYTRDYDYEYLGPATSWDQYRVLPAGTYYIAISADGIVYSGDTYGNALLEAPIHYDYTTYKNNLPEITQPLGTFQYYDDPNGYQNYGNIVLNVTQTPAGVQKEWNVDGNGNWSSGSNWAGSVPQSAGDTASFLATNTAARTVTLDAPETVGHLVFDSAFQYTIAGTQTLTLNNGTSPSDVIINTGSHVISAPLAAATNTTIIAPAGTGLSITGPLAIAAGVTLTKDGAGALAISGAETNGIGSAIYIGEGTATITSDPGANVALTSTATVTFPASTGSGIRPIHLASLNLSLSGLTNGIVTFAGPGRSNESNRTVLVTSALNFTGTSTTGWVGQLDLGGNDIIIHNGNLTQLTSQLASGYARGSWQGSTGIVSFQAQTDPTHLTAIGLEPNSASGYTSFDTQGVSSTDVLIKYTYYGDANLDGRVDSADYTRIDGGFLSHATGWWNGDFNYDGLVNGSDYTLIDNAFNTHSASITSAVAIPTAQLFSSSVPEPTAMLFTTLVISATLGRRKRARFQNFS